jgi:putative RNA 2'-phosphotransferase
MDVKKEKRISKFLSMILRHKPEIIGIALDPSGWADVQELLQKLNKRDMQN